MPGYLGVDSVHQKNGAGITVSYWDSEAAIKARRDEVEHSQARRRGKAHWYKAYDLKVARIERSCSWQSDP